MKRIVLVASLAGLAAGAQAGIASGATFCVNQPSCSGTPEATLQAAFTAAGANSEDDVIQVGAGTYVGGFNSGEGFSLVDTTHSVSLMGAGPGQTIIDPAAGATTTGTYDTVDYQATGGTISGVTIRRAPGTSGQHAGLALFGPVTASGISVTEVDTSNASPGTGVDLHSGGATLQSSTVSLPATAVISAVIVNAGFGDAVNDSTLSAYYGVYSQKATGVDVRRDSITIPAGGFTGVYGYGSVALQDNVIRLLGSGENGIVSHTDSANDSSFTGEFQTIYGGTGDTGVSANGPVSGTHTTTVQLSSSIVRGVQTSMAQAAGTGTAVLTVSYSDFDEAATVGTVGMGIGDLNNFDPLFLDAANGDFRLRHDSPVIDRADPAAPGVGASQSDLAGKPRKVDGDGNGSAIGDMGAFEYQRSAPVALATASPTSAAVGQSIAFDGTGSSDPDPGDTLSYAWSFDDGATAAGATATHGFATPGAHSGTLTVTDSTGRTATATASVTVVAPTTGTTPPPTTHDAFAGAKALGGTVTVTPKGVARVRVACRRPAPGGCRGKLTLRRGRRTLGSASFSIPEGATRRVSVKLSHRALALLVRKLRVQARVRSHDGRGTTKSTSTSITLTRAARRRH